MVAVSLAGSSATETETETAELPDANTEVTPAAQRPDEPTSLLKKTWTSNGLAWLATAEQPGGLAASDPVLFTNLSPDPAMVFAAAWKHSWNVMIGSAQAPEAPNWSQHRIPSPQQLPISMDNTETTAHGQCGVGWSRELREKWSGGKNEVEVAVPSDMTA